ncbi:MAG: (2Fe-2S)-binding protein, partial [Streptosporangiaceae bacterium]
LYPLPPGWVDELRPDTVVCRCEDVTWDRVRAAVADGAYDMRSLKGLTRCGMGYCQGRVCGSPLQCALAELTGRGPADVGDLHKRTIATPVPLSDLTELT